MEDGSRGLRPGQHATPRRRLDAWGAGKRRVILFRRSVLSTAYGQQARLLAGFWEEAERWDWDDRIEYLPRP